MAAVSRQLFRPSRNDLAAYYDFGTRNTLIWSSGSPLPYDDVEEGRAEYGYRLFSKAYGEDKVRRQAHPSATWLRESVLPIRLRPDFLVVFEGYAGGAEHWLGRRDAYNFGRRLKTLRGLAPYEFIVKCWISEPERFTLDPTHQTPGPNT